jgi:hypothetical protein
VLALGPLGTGLAARPGLVVAESVSPARPIRLVTGRTALRPVISVAAVSTVPVSAATILGAFGVRTTRGARLIAALRGPALVAAVSFSPPAAPFPAAASRTRPATAGPASISG